MFHDFSNRFASGQSNLTGFVHIGIAVGIFVAMYRLFIRLIGEFFMGFSDLKSKKIRENSKKPAREFLYFAILSFLPLLFWLIPCGEKGTLYNVLALTQVNKTLLDDGIFIALLGGLLIAANINITREKNDRAIWVVPAIASGVLCVFSATLSGLSLIGVALCVLLLFGVRTKQALNFTFVLSFEIFLVSGIVEAVTNEVKADIISAVVGLVVAHPKMNLPMYTGFHNATSGDLFPILFVTVACGAVSGFHSLVSSGTSSKTIANEKDMQKVGYGAMVLESLLAVLALCVAGAAASADGTAAVGTPFAIFSSGVAGFLEMFGIPVYGAQCFMTMCVSALALTSLDSVARIGRMSFQELFTVDDMEHAAGWRKLLCNKYFSTIVTLLCGYILTQIGYANIWPLFGSANQMLSALVLITLCVFLKVTGRENRTLFPPLIIMLCVTFTALVERVIALVKAYGAGTAVFLVEGLQLIIAILLMVLGVIIVISCGKELFRKKAGQETK